MTQRQYVLHLHWTFHVTLRWMIRNKSVRHLSCNTQGMINIRWHFFQIKLLKQHFLLLPRGTTGIHVWFVKGCMRWAMLASGLNCPCEPFSLLLGSMALPGPGDCPRQPMSSSWWGLKIFNFKESKAARLHLLIGKENAPGLWSAEHAREVGGVLQERRWGFEKLRADADFLPPHFPLGFAPPVEILDKWKTQLCQNVHLC